MTAALRDKTVLVTGGTTGIGLATVRAILDAGANVVAASRNAERGRAVIASLDNDRATFHPVDVTDEASVASLIDVTIERFGVLDHLFNNAGHEGAVGPMSAWSEGAVGLVLDVNVKGAFLCMKHAAPRMASGSVIVNTSSLLGTIPMPLAAPYAASKAALLSLSRSAAAELSESGISVFAICPAVVDTPMIERVSAAAGAPKEALAEMVCPSGRVTSPERVAEVVRSLFENRTCYPTGTLLRIAPDVLEPIG
jgi:NAD(P)-dependent dehydrogenase (short-subunit alcohol dehydrogenase family)